MNHPFDQPKSEVRHGEPTGEWTVTDFGLVRLNGKDMVTALTYDQGKALVDAIKVALTAERNRKVEEVWKLYKGVDPDTGEMWLTPRMERDAKVLELQWQLTAEREKFQKALCCNISEPEREHMKVMLEHARKHDHQE